MFYLFQIEEPDFLTTGNLYLNNFIVVVEI